MCSVQEEGVVMPERRPDFETISRGCMKCGEKASLVIRVNDAFCKACFLRYCTHKFRSAFGKSQLIRDGEEVLVAFSGGQGATAMLHLIQEGLSEKAKKKLRFRPELCFVDEGAVVNHTAPQRLQTSEKINSVMQATGFPCHMTSLEQALIVEGDPDSTQTKPDDQKNGDLETAGQKLITMIGSIKSLTAQEDIISTLRNRLLIKIATKQSCSKILLADTATRLSVTLLSNIAQGRGAHLPLDVGFVDNRYEDTLFVRPMREFTSKEVAMYNVFNSLEPVAIPKLATKTNTNSSIDRLTETFVNGLQADFPSTVTTILRTGDKLDSHSQRRFERVEDEDEYCVLCQVTLDTRVPKSSALNSTLYSEIMSKKRNSEDVEHHLTKCQDDSSAFGEDSDCCGGHEQDSNSSWLTKDQLNDSLCYGCRLLTKDLDDIHKLPVHVLRNAAWRVKSSRERANIQEFLLENEQDISPR